MTTAAAFDETVRFHCPTCHGIGATKVPLVNAGPTWESRWLSKKCPNCHGVGRLEMDVDGVRPTARGLSGSGVAEDRFRR